MNAEDQDRWKSETLDEVFAAFAASEELRANLVFKGARVLHRRLPTVRRQSLDIDSNLAPSFLERHASTNEQRDVLEGWVRRALMRHFEAQDPVRFQLESVVLKAQPPKGHPRGWNAFLLRVRVRDLSKPARSMSALPTLEIDIAAPEALLPGSVATLVVGDHEVRAYTLERIAGEKLRAFLTSLPAYRSKLGRPGNAVRAKDLHDEALILREHPLPDDAPFWRAAGAEFRRACESRHVDCEGISSFTEAWEVTRQTYGDGTMVGADVDFDEAERALRAIVDFLAQEGIVPFRFPLPPIAP